MGKSSGLSVGEAGTGDPNVLITSIRHIIRKAVSSLGAYSIYALFSSLPLSSFLM